MRYIVTLVVIVLIAVAGYGMYVGWFTSETTTTPTATTTESTTTDTTTDTAGETGTTTDTTNTNGQTDQAQPATETIGSSVNGHDITVHHYGDGEREVLFVGGIHGAYGWNTALVAYELMDYLEGGSEAIPENVTVSVIPVLNPDGLNKVVGTTGRFDRSQVPDREETIPGRFNGNNVDLNRNFDCNWQSQGQWQERTVDGGSEPFSEPESKVLRDYVTENDPDAAVIWYSAAGEVIPASCGKGIAQEARTLMNTYADASGYTPKESFDYYTLTGDAADWMAKKGIPAISVVLDTHTSVEWSKNKQGINALLNELASQ